MVVNKLSLPQTSHIYTYGVVCLWMRKNVLRRNGAAPDCPAPKRLRQNGRAKLSCFVPSYMYLREICRPPSLLVQQAAVHCDQLSTAIWRSRLRQCRAVPFQWLVQQPGTSFPQI